MNPSSNCRTSIFEEEFKFQYVRENVHIHIATQNIILTFLSKWHFAWQCKYGRLGQKYFSNLPTCMYGESIGRFKYEICTISYAPQLN